MTIHARHKDSKGIVSLNSAHFKKEIEALNFPNKSLNFTTYPLRFQQPKFPMQIP